MSGHALLKTGPAFRMRMLHAAALARRAAWRLEDSLRSRVQGAGADLPRRPPPEGEVSFPEAATPVARAAAATARAARPGSDRVGVLTSGPGAGMPAAGLIGEVLGLHVVDAPPPAWAGVIEQAAREEWPLLVVHLGGDPRTAGALAGLRRFVERGGEVLVLVEPEADVTRLGRALGHDLPAPRPVRTRASGLRFSSREPELTSWFTGAAVSGGAIPWCLGPAPGARVLAWSGEGQAGGQAGGQEEPVLTVTSVGEGAVFISVAGDGLAGALRDRLSPPHWPEIVPPLLLIRRLYAELAWHAPVPFANLTIDDPALTGGHLGLDYEGLVGLAEAGGYHVTIATIPRELGAADPSVLRLLTSRRDRLTACYHGWSHRGYEFFLPGAGRGRFRSRPLEEQERAIERAAGAGRRFWQRTGLALDRVMVFPHGIAAPATLSALGRHGFLASCNFDERDPLGAHPPAERDLGLRPADTAWADVPLLWRRGLDDPRFLIDIGFGRPLLSFGHRRQIGPRLERFAGYAARVGSAAPGLRWGGLEEVARHAYLVRRDPVAGWQVLMTADTICLHNDGASPRRYTIRRPHVPDGAHLGDCSVEVGPGQSRQVSRRRTTGSALPGPYATCRPEVPARGRTTCSPPASDGERLPSLQLEASP